MRPHGDAHRGIHAVELFDGEGVRNIVEPGAAILLGHQRAEKTRLAQAAHDLVRELVRLVEVVDGRSDLGQRPFARHAAHRLLFRCQVEVHG